MNPDAVITIAFAGSVVIGFLTVVLSFWWRQARQEPAREAGGPSGRSGHAEGR